MKVFQVFFGAVLLLLSQGVDAGEFDDHSVTALAGGMFIKTKYEINTVFEGKTYCFTSQESQ
jgi:hypothetical protein